MYGENHPEVAAIFCKLGHLCSKKKEFANAILLYNEALDIERSHYDEAAFHSARVGRVFSGPFVGVISGARRWNVARRCCMKAMLP